MTPKQKKLVQDSWSRLLPVRDTAAQIFYTHLFEMHPEVRTYFKGDMREQGGKLMAMMNTAVRGLDNMDVLAGPLKKSGKAHRAYGVQPEDYAKVGEALLWTLEKGLGDSFDDDAKQAWRVAYDSIAKVMIDGAASVGSQSPCSTSQSS